MTGVTPEGGIPGGTPLGGGAHLASHHDVVPVMATASIPRRTVPKPRTLPDGDIERGARIVGLVDSRPRHRDGGPIRKRDAILAAVRRAIPGITA